MKSPDAQALLQAWEVGHGEHNIRRALALLAAAWPQTDVQSWSRLTIGERDRHLLELREMLFGRQLQTIASCPACGERLESSFTTDDVRVSPASSDASQVLIQLRLAHCEIEYRLPTSEDLLEICDAKLDSAGARATLLRRCVAAASLGHASVDPADLPAPILASLSADMQEHDPGADVHVSLSCPACHHGWTLGFDIVSYIWGEIEDWAQRLLAEVHELAQTYGWSERDILALNPTRRQLYLEMVRA